MRDLGAAEIEKERTELPRFLLASQLLIPVRRGQLYFLSLNL